MMTQMKMEMRFMLQRTDYTVDDYSTSAYEEDSCSEEEAD